MKYNLTEFSNLLHRKGIVGFSLVLYLISKWEILTSEQAYSAEFFYYHLPFELAFQSLDAFGTLPTWLPLYQGGRALFADMLFYYSPFSIDFIPTYFLAKFLGLDHTLGLKVLNLWRITLLTVFFAFGCRKLAQEILEYKFSPDFVFVVVLFATGLAIPHYPTLATVNVFFPWILFYLVRLTKHNPERFLHLAAGLALFAGAGLFQLFNQHTLFAWVVIVFFGTILVVSNAGRPFRKWFFRRDEQKRKVWVLVLAVAVLVSVLPVIWEMVYFFQNNYREIINFGNWEQIRTLIDIPGMGKSHIVYLGILPFFLFSAGLFFGRGKYHKPAIWGLAGFGLTLMLDPFPSLGIPIMALIAGMGLDRIIASKNFYIWKESQRGWVVGSILCFAFLGIVIFYLFYWIRLVVLNHVFQNMGYSMIYVLAFGLISIAGLGLVFRSVGFGTAAVLVGIVILDIGVFDHLVNTRSPSYARTPTSGKFSISGLKETKVPELPVLKYFPQFASNSYRTYDNNNQPIGYAPRLQQYGMINNKFYNKQASQLSPNMLDAISGYSLPRAFFVKNGFEDPRGEMSTIVLRAGEDESLLSKVVFINESIESKYQHMFLFRRRPNFSLSLKNSLLSRKSLEKLGDSPSDPNILLKRTYVNVPAALIRSNLPLTPSLLERLVNGRDIDFSANQLDFEPNESGWIIIDFGRRSPEINMIEVYYRSSGYFKNWMWDGSWDGETWERLGYFNPSLNVKGNKQEWPVVEGKGFRYYRLSFVISSIPLKMESLPRFRLARDARELGAHVSQFEFEKRIPFLRFSNLGQCDDSGFFVFGYDLGVGSMGRSFSTEPTQRFGYILNLNWEDGERPLAPTWANEWNREDFFQIGYQYPGYLTINVPPDRVMEYRQRVLQVKVALPDFGIHMVEYSANRVKFTKEPPEAGWLYYADTMDKYWTAIGSNGEVMPVNRANLQFKAVFVGPGHNVIEFIHQPTLFYQLVGLTYGAHIFIALIWIFTKRNKMRIGMSTEEVRL